MFEFLFNSECLLTRPSRSRILHIDSQMHCELIRLTFSHPKLCCRSSWERLSSAEDDLAVGVSDVVYSSRPTTNVPVNLLPLVLARNRPPPASYIIFSSASMAQFASPSIHSGRFQSLHQILECALEGVPAVHVTCHLPDDVVWHMVLQPHRVAPINRVIAAVAIKVERICGKADWVGLEKTVQCRGVEPVAHVIQAGLRQVLAPGEEEPCVID